MKNIILILAFLGLTFQLKAQSPSQIITAMEYYIDIDPGPGNGTALAITSSSSIDDYYTTSVPAGSIGFHNLFIRVKDQNNSWSISQRSEFYVPAPLPQNIVKLQYYFDIDPGVDVAGNGAIIPVTPGSNLNQNFAITIPGPFTAGYHNLFIRTQNEFGVWSIAERKPFGIGECVSITNDDNATITLWTFDEFSQTGVTDIYGNHDGVLLNGASTMLYAEFDGINDYIGIPDSDDFAFGTKDFSIEFFANFLSPGGDIAHPEDKFIGQSEGAGDAKKWTFALGGGKLFFRLSNGSSSQNLVQFPFAPVINQWYHIALTRKADTLRTYINGLLAGTEVVAGLTIPNVNSALTIGWVEWIQGGSPGFMHGKLDEMTVFRRALMLEEITSIYNAGAGGKCKSVQIKTSAISDAKYETEFSQTLEAALGIQPYTWTVSAGELPDGITLSSDGVLSGTPSEAGEFEFKVQVKDANNLIDITDFTFLVNITLPEPQFNVFKSGTSAVPGREMDYFILVENISTVNAESFILEEYLEPWFNYISSTPIGQEIVKVPNQLTPETDSLTSVIAWNLNLQPGESKLISYKVKLDPNFPLGDTVNGTVCLYKCLTLSEAIACHANELACAFSCNYLEGIGCAGECLEEIFPSPAFTRCWLKCMLTEYGSCMLDCIQGEIDCITEAAKSDCNECTSDSQPAEGAIDPNEKLVLAEKYIQPDNLLPFVIHFENIGTIEARDVFIKDTLDEDLDESTLNIITPGGIYNPVTRVLKWDLYNINLLPDNGAYVMYTAKPNPNLPSGTVIHNTGHIQFEVFDIFSTNQTENIIDYSDPEGIMDALPATMYQTAFPISWSGMDAVGEIKHYSIFVSKNGEGYELFLSKTQKTSTIFIGETGNTYSFICIAEDLAGNIEVQEPIAEATTHLDVLCTDVYYYDADNDGYGGDIPTTSCNQPTGFVINSADCNDASAVIHPGATEVCNFIDDDCDGLTDEGVTTIFYRDADTDGFGKPDVSVTTCNQPSGYVTNGNDCDDTNAAINPGVIELHDGIDNDCDGLIDEDFSDLIVDAGDCKKVYRGYSPAECTILTVTIEGGSAPHSYSWSNGSTATSITVCPTQTTNYTVTVTDDNGFTAQDVVNVNVIDIRCGNKNDKVFVCHLAGGNNLCIAPVAVQAHLDHGDYLGICNATDPCEPASLKGSPKDIKSQSLAIKNSEKIAGDDEIYFLLKPNPADDHVEIQTNLIQGTINLMDVSGRIILKQEISSQKNLISTSLLTNGIYFIRLKSGSNCYLKSIVVMH